MTYAVTGLNETVLGVAAGIGKKWPHVKRGMRPGGLGQILDRRADAAVPFDQQHVTRLETGQQAIWRRGRSRATLLYFLGKKSCQPGSQPVEQKPHFNP
jgi:hypothetical protein